MAKDDIDKCSKAYRQSAAFKRASFHPPDEIWSIFSDTEGFVDVIHVFKALVDSLTLEQDLHGLEFYQVLKSKLTSWKCQSLWDLLNSRLKCKEYKHENVAVGKNIKCIIVGAGPIGLRTAIEMSMLGCRTIVVEKRKDFTRNNVLHLWPFLLHDFRTLGAKKFYGKFGAGCIDHINIKTLQTILLKVALVLGVEIHPGVEFKDIIEPTDDHGWRATFNPPNIENLSKCDFDVIVGADGKKNVLPGFKQLELRGSLAIGITCNFINSNTPEETNCKEISGISYQFKPAFFDEMKAKHGVELENIVYYKDETHYFVMTARKNSLLNQGVLLKDSADPALLCQSSNVNIEKLADYTCKAVRYSTTLTKLEFKKLANGKPDIALFDFTSLKKADSASRILERNKKKLILALVGDSLIEPFWPTGSGCGRGVLSALDVAWMVRQFALNYPPLVMLRERENVFKLLSASTHDNMQKNYSSYTIDPKTRYPALDVKKITNLDSLKSLYDTDDLSADLTLSSPTLPQKSYLKKKTAVDRRKSGGSSATRPSGKIVAGKTKRKLERQESKSHRHEEKKLSIKDKKNFFEEHNKKMGMGTEVEKPKRQTLPSNDFSGLEGIDEDIHESDDEVLVDEPVAKKKIEDTATSKRTGHKEILDTSKGRSMKRTPSKDGAKRSTSKSLKRQQSKDGEISEPSTDEVPVVKKKIFQAKGGGLKSKSRGESRKSSERLKSTSEKKSTIRRKSRKSAGSSSEVEASREEPVETIQPVDAKTFFSKWLESLIPRLFKDNTPTPPPATFQHPLDVCIQTSVMSVMAVSLLYDCNKPPRRRTTELKLKEILANSKPKDEKIRSEAAEELSFIRQGRVRDSMKKWQELAEKEEQKHDYYDFVKKKQESSPETEKKEGVLLLKQPNADFTPKDVIDIEEQLITEEEEERKRSRLAKMTTGIPSNGGLELKLALERFSDQLSPANAILMLQVLYNIHKRILDAPKVDKHYRIYTKSKTFQNHVWKWEGAKDYFLYVGWVMCGDFLVLSKSQPVHFIVKVIEDVFRKNKKVQILYSGSLKSRSDVTDGRRSSKIVEDEYTNIEAPPERDSAIGSGMEDEDELDIKPDRMEHKLLKGLRSKEHSMGDEAYIVVDFVNDSDVVTEPPVTPSAKEEIVSTAEHEILVENSSPFTTVKNPLKSDNDFTFEMEDDHPVDDVKISVRLSNESDDRYEVLSEVPPDVVKTEVFDVEVKIETQETVVVSVKEDTVSDPQVTDLNNVNMETNVVTDSIITPVVSTEPSPTTPTTSGKRKVFSAGHGLKKAKEDRAKLDEKMNDQEGIPKQEVPSKTGKSSPSLRKDLTPVSTPPKQRSSPGSGVTSPVLNRTPSSKSLNSDSPSISIVKQNALLFDQQIANELKAKYPSQQDKMGPRFGSAGKGSLNGFELQASERAESNYSSDSNELNLSGIVAGARSKFESSGDGGKPKYEKKLSSSNLLKKEVPLKANDEKVVTPVSQESIIINTVPDLPKSEHKKKKKKFPFKKGKGKDKRKERSDSVELIGAKLIDANQPFEERAIDVGPITPVQEPSVERGLPDMSTKVVIEHDVVNDHLIGTENPENEENPFNVENTVASEIMTNGVHDVNGVFEDSDIGKTSDGVSSNGFGNDIVVDTHVMNEIKTNGVCDEVLDDITIKGVLNDTKANGVFGDIEVNGVHDEIKGGSGTEVKTNIPEIDTMTESFMVNSDASILPEINTVAACSGEVTTDSQQSLDVVDKTVGVEGGEMQRTRSKKRRLCKARNPSVLSNNDPLPSNPDEKEIISEQVIEPTNKPEVYATGTIVNLIPSDEEEVMTEIVLKDDAAVNWSFDKLAELSCEEVSNKTNSDIIIDVAVEPSKIDIDSLHNESSIDDDIVEKDKIPLEVRSDTPVTETEVKTNELSPESTETNNIASNISITVDDPEGDCSSILDGLSDATGSFYDGDNASMNLSLNMDSPTDSVEVKKKKKFPFQIKFSKKRDKSKSDLGDNVFSEDASSESSFRVKKKKKKSKSNGNENVHENDQNLLSTSSVDTYPDKSPSLSQKSKSKKFNFFKKKKSSSTLSSSSFSDSHEPNQIGTTDNAKGVTTPTLDTPSTPKHDKNGSTNHTNGHTNAHTNRTNVHKSFPRENLI